jgi:hypothetical protein
MSVGIQNGASADVVVLQMVSLAARCVALDEPMRSRLLDAVLPKQLGAGSAGTDKETRRCSDVVRLPPTLSI